MVILGTVCQQCHSPITARHTHTLMNMLRDKVPSADAVIDELSKSNRKLDFELVYINNIRINAKYEVNRPGN